jgi:hypothetical protein
VPNEKNEGIDLIKIFLDEVVRVVAREYPEFAKLGIPSTGYSLRAISFPVVQTPFKQFVTVAIAERHDLITKHNPGDILVGVTRGIGYNMATTDLVGSVYDPNMSAGIVGIVAIDEIGKTRGI